MTAPASLHLEGQAGDDATSQVREVLALHCPLGDMVVTRCSV